MPNSNPGFEYGDIPSAVEWDAAFTTKVDAADGLFTTPVQLKVYTVSTLPTPASGTGWLAAVSDATSPTYGGALTGGGSTFALALWNGSAWRAH